MHVKYFQPIADLYRHYEDIMRNFEKDSKYGLMLLETWGIREEDKQDIIEEKEVLRYLLACRHGIARKVNVKKPTIEVVNRCFHRHLDFLEKIHKCHAYNVNKLTYPHASLIQKQYKACRHYLFKFSLPAWYEKLPDEILSFENRYPHFNK